MGSVYYLTGGFDVLYTVSVGMFISLLDPCSVLTDFSWFGCGAGTEDSGFLCGLLQQESSCTTPPNLHEPWFLGLQGEGSTDDAAEFSQGLVFPLYLFTRY